ncbi:zeta toxin family protein [Chitinophaga qingshengii]|uniref:Zeta toxin family protein n=1 Tax=Chitinophaga qingshengii TaxID=1569794 RepID=A0ABR7THN9_9BACT|nr:zeta toxin family protein [Chitinophaga qingshengii]MBC9930017.1 zeta toxin family protein [Chitinophaga qingshengii]
MSTKFARFLNTQQQIDDFLSGPLGLDTSTLPEDVPAKIITCEKGVLDGLENPTSFSNHYRVKKYTDHKQRLALRNTIVQELFTQQLLENDDNICLGRGGAMPQNPTRKKQAFMLIGLPASGKSSVAAQIAQNKGAVVLDSDLAKRKLPEYAQYPWGASLVNAESSMIVFGDKNDQSFISLYEQVVKEKYNVVIPKIGAEPEDILPYCINLKKLKYKVHLTLVYLPKEKSTVRALNRYLCSNRYIPLTLIFDVFSNNPALTYFKLKNAKHDYFDTFGIINTDVPPKSSFLHTDISGNTNPAKMYKKAKNALI